LLSNKNTNANTTPCVKATTSLLELGGRVRTTPGVRTTKRRTINAKRRICIFIYTYYEEIFIKIEKSIYS